ncbi:MAG: transposase [Thermodesulfobacteriota bacterium]
MPRTARIAPKGYVYHVLTRGNNGQDVFKDEGDFKKYLDLILHYKEKYKFKLYHYVLMANHVHLVIEALEEGGELSEIMKGINLAYALYYKRKYNYKGHLWQDRYKSIIISKDNYLLACGSYVELNPIRAGIVKDPSQYPWSSYIVYGHGKAGVLVDEHPIYEQLAEVKREREKKYREFVWEMLRGKEAMKGEMEKRMIYGDKGFLQKIEKDHHISEKISPQGRQVGWRKNKENRPL